MSIIGCVYYKLLIINGLLNGLSLNWMFIVWGVYYRDVYYRVMSVISSAY